MAAHHFDLYKGKWMTVWFANLSNWVVLYDIVKYFIVMSCIDAEERNVVTFVRLAALHLQSLLFMKTASKYKMYNIYLMSDVSAGMYNACLMLPASLSLLLHLLHLLHNFTFSSFTPYFYIYYIFTVSTYRFLTTHTKHIVSLPQSNTSNGRCLAKFIKRLAHPWKQ